jgi:hypothetical protein
MAAGMNRVAPFSAVNSSSGHMMLTTTSGPDADAHRRAQLAVAQDPVEHVEQERLGGRAVERAGLGEQGVDPLGIVAVTRPSLRPLPVSCP